jgi:hypothetical protein
MKKVLLVTFLVTALLISFTQCSEDEVITPKEEALQSQMDADPRESRSCFSDTAAEAMTLPRKAVALNGLKILIRTPCVLTSF